MSLKIVRRNGALYIHGTVTPAGAKAGVRIRCRAGTNEPRLAEEEARALEAKILRDHHLGERPAVRGFDEAALSYLDATERTKEGKAQVRRLAMHFRHMPVDRIGQEQADGAVRALCRSDAAPGTRRRQVLVPLTAILNHAARRGWCQPPRFEKPKEGPGRTAIITPAQFEAMLQHAAPRLRPLWTLLICTGMRMGEALGLQWHEVDLTGARISLSAARTKARKARIVHLSPAAVAALAGVTGRTGHVFRNRRGAPYWGTRDDDEGTGGQLRKPWATMCRKAGISGITPHSLRHSFASWHWARHRDLFALRRAGGWSTTEMVERYEHALPAGHEADIDRVWGIAAVTSLAQATGPGRASA